MNSSNATSFPCNNNLLYITSRERLGDRVRRWVTGGGRGGGGGLELGSEVVMNSDQVKGVWRKFH